MSTTITTPFQTLFAVPMTCEGCAKDVSGVLYKLPGVNRVDTNVKDQLVSIEGTAPPSVVVAAIEATGRDAVLRGSGASDASAVSILETYHQPPSEVANGGGATGAWFNERMVRGLARMVQVSPTSTLVDLTLRGVAPGTYRASVREYGNLRDGASSTGPIWSGGQQTSGTSGHARGALGTVEVGPDGRGSAFISLPFQVWEVTGHALVVTQQDEEGGAALKNDADTVAGVIARSAGVWDNDKVVCSCTGKTLWEERKDEVTKGML